MAESEERRDSDGRGEPRPIKGLKARREERARRRVAAERLSSPDQLDQVIEVARPRHWLGLLGLSILVAGAVVASVALTVPVTVRGEGILINVGGILTVTSDTEGRLLELLVSPGSRVARGELVARVDQPALALELENRRAELAEARERRGKISAFQDRTDDTQTRTLANRRRALEQRLGSARNLLRSLEEQLEADRSLNEEGIVPRRQLAETRARVDRARDEVLAVESEIERFAQVVSDRELTQERELLGLDLEIGELEREVRTLERELERHTEVVSPYAGRVVELKVNPGEIVARNGPLFSLLPSGAAAGDALVAVLYVPPAEGKKVLEGMEVRVVPTSVKREEHGFMFGRVDAVAEVPATPEGMMRILKNSQLVAQLSHDHAPFEVLVRLLRDPSTESGYRWSSSDGPPTKIHVGTLCRAEIVTRRERPIVLLIPALKRFFDD